MSRSVRATDAERNAAMAGDEIVADADAVMDRAFTVPGPPEDVWPWILQLGKRRAGWYLPKAVERWIPRSRRALRSVDDLWLHLGVGDVIPDYGGQDATFTVAQIAAPHTLVYRSQRGSVSVSWSIALSPAGAGATRVHLRLRLGPVKRLWLVNTVGEMFDALTIAGLAAGLRERLAP
ncbi:SRPBCC family protein [Aeromicrobium sp. 9AM]|uniref:SRPBCC family protein n=1 Tax=Aeromicrobium sp. 9AM TaxID=2653126 RepID=UPI0012F18F26|nr:SRPBCC family protein [Aeromicrobium sp. 9AM]VXC56580.1 conserved hypothetical protein [Aeromicrobium sp. 9AM]